MKLSQLFEKSKKLSSHQKFLKKYNITKVGPGSIGLDPQKNIYYGWSHRAIVGFKIGDKLFEPNFGDDDTPFTQHGSKTIKTIEDAKKAAQSFSEYVS